MQNDKLGYGVLSVLLALSVAANMALVVIMTGEFRENGDSRSGLWIEETMDTVYNWGQNRVEIYSQRHDELEVHHVGDWEFAIVPIKGRHGPEEGLKPLQEINHCQAIEAICFILAKCDPEAGRKGLQLLRQADPGFRNSWLTSKDGEIQSRWVGIDEFCKVAESTPDDAFTENDPIGGNAKQFTFRAQRYSYLLDEHKKDAIISVRFPGNPVDTEDVPADLQKQAESNLRKAGLNAK